MPHAALPQLTVALALAPMVLAAVPARGEAAPGCVRGTSEPRVYLDCLNRAQRASERHVEHVVAAARAAIEARDELPPAQRKRWIALLDEAQGRFVNWRNFECQSIAPYEGGGGQKTIGGRLGGIGVLEGRMTCLTTLNEARATDLERRYTLPAYVTAPEPEPEPAPAAAESPSAAPAPSGPVRIIDLPAQTP